jgi:hypothetical protein
MINGDKEGRLMKKTAISVVAVSALTLGSATVAMAVTKTSADVKTLASAESKVVTLLHHYKNSATWKSQFKAAIAAQNADVTKVETDLAPKTKTTTTTTVPPTTTSSPTATTAPASSSGVLGSTLDFKDASGVPYTVTLNQVFDSAQGVSPSASPSSGDRFYAASFTITDTGTASTSGETGEARIMSSQGINYPAISETVNECNSFGNGNGEYQLVSGGSVTGCITFSLPVAVSVSDVEWSTGGNFAIGYSEWNVSG